MNKPVGNSTQPPVQPNGKRHSRLFQGILPLSRATIGNDMMAGIVLAALGIPEVMGYTKISGTPIATGLYTLMVPALVFAVLGASRHLAVAADSATAAILAAGLLSLAPAGSAHYLALAELVAIVVAGLLLLVRLLRLGFLADFLSRTVLIGFLTGVGIQVAIGQLPGLIDRQDAGHHPLPQILNTIAGIPPTNPLAIGIAITVLVTIHLFERHFPKFPGALLAVVGAILASWHFDFASRGISVVGTLPHGLPTFGFPAIALNEIPQVFGIALS
jgi:sulfate permease, SulP family